MCCNSFVPNKGLVVVPLPVLVCLTSLVSFSVFISAASKLRKWPQTCLIWILSSMPVSSSLHIF
jgi:hypothetical protein